MFLHNDGKRFAKLIKDIYTNTGIKEALIEKDYFATLFLKHLAKKEPLLVFKGGTCLSKCFKLVKRFSEDIDINLLGMEGLSHRRKKQMKYNIVDTIDKLELNFSNPEDVRSGRDHNVYKISYPAAFEDPSIKPHLEVETYFLIESFPIVKMGVASLIYDYLKERGYNDVISEFGLEPFEVCVQALERTFADKVFAVCDYHMTGKINGQSRHLYDIHKILPHMTLDGNMKNFMEEIRRVREGKRDCLSANKDADLPDMIDKVTASDAYMKDYRERTAPLLYETVAYADIAATMKEIADWLRRS